MQVLAGVVVGVVDDPASLSAYHTKISSIVIVIFVKLPANYYFADASLFKLSI